MEIYNYIVSKLIQFKQWVLSVDTVPVTPSDVGKCTKCRFHNEEYQCCTTGTYWAKKGLKRICFEGELWQAIKH